MKFCILLQAWQNGAGRYFSTAVISFSDIYHVNAAHHYVAHLQVWVNDEEVERMARYLRMQLPQFKSRHLKQYSKRPGWHMLRSKPGSEKVHSACVDLHINVAATMPECKRIV